MPHGTGEGRSPLTGQLLADRYRLDAPIEAGRMGEVWSARDTVLNRPVAVKMINQAHAADEALVSRFRAESRYAAALSHSGVAQVFDYGEQDSASLPCPYLVMEHVSGRPLAELIAQAGALPADMVLDITAQAAGALQAAHDIGITHRDIKPANLLITDDGLVKITDFGTAALTPGSQVATVADAELVRSAAYLSPEQAEGKPATHASDIYSLGVVAYECATGRLPFSGRTLRALSAAREAEPWPLPDHIPAPVRDLIMRMIARDPWLRPGTAHAVAEKASALRKQLLSSAGLRAGAARTGAGWTGPVAAEAGPLTAGTSQAMGISPAVGTRPATRSSPAMGTGRAVGTRPAPGTGTVAQEAGPMAAEAAPIAAGTGTDPATTTAPQPRIEDALAGTSRRRRRRAMAVAAAAVGVTALAGAIAAMMFGGNGGKPPPVARNADTPGPGVQAVVPAMGPTAHPAKTRAIRRPRTATASRSATARPSRAGGAAAPAPSRPASPSPVHSTGPKPSPSTTPSTPTRSPTPGPTPTMSPSAASPG